MLRENIPSFEELMKHKESVPEIDPTAVIAMLELRQAGEMVDRRVLDVLSRKYHLSEGKFIALIVLHQEADGLAPSVIAKRAELTKATISNMLQDLVQSGFVEIRPDENDGRGKIARMTEKGRAFMNEILPEHYVRVTEMMQPLTHEEQEELSRLLQKLTAGESAADMGTKRPTAAKGA